MDPYIGSNQASPGPIGGGSRKRMSTDRRASSDTRKRQMVSRACDACKQRKAKCSGTVPCSSCTKRDIPCLYESKYARGRPPTPQPTIALEEPKEADTTQRDDQGDQNTSGQSQESVTQLRPAVSRASPVLGVTEIQGQYVEPTSGLAFLHRAWKRLSHQRTTFGASCTSPGMGTGSIGGYERLQLQDRAGDKLYDEDKGPGALRGSVFSIPSLAVSKDMVSYYHDVCVATYRFLHQPSVISWLEQVHSNLDCGLPIEHGIGSMKAAIVLVVLAVAIYHQGKSRDEAGKIESSNATNSGNTPGTATTTAESAAGITPDKDIEIVIDEVSTRKSDRLFLAAVRLTTTAKGYPSLDSVQAHLVQVLYLLHASRFNQAWYVFGHTVQIIAALGLHRKRRVHRSHPSINAAASADTAQDYIDSQCRKRCFWVAYILDAYLGVMFGRPRHYHDENIDQELPDTINDDDMGKPASSMSKRRPDSPMESLIFHTRIVRIVGRISQSVYAVNNNQNDSIGDVQMLQTVQQIRTDIDAWTASLPTLLSSVHPTSLVYPFRRQATTMRLARAHAIIHLNRPFLLRQIGQASSTGQQQASSWQTSDDSQMTEQLPTALDQVASSRKAVADCLSAAREVLGIVDLMAQGGTLFYAFWWTHYVTFCSLAVVYVWEIQRSTLESSREDNTTEDPNELFQLAERCQMHLARATSRNSPSRRYSIILEELRQEALGRTGQSIPEQERHQLSLSSERMQQQQQQPQQQYPYPYQQQFQQPRQTFGHEYHNGQLPENSVLPAGQMQGPGHNGLGHNGMEINNDRMTGPNVIDGMLSNQGPDSTSGLTGQWDGWQTMDWLDLDAMALGSFSGLATSPDAWGPSSFSLGNGVSFMPQP